jgi:nitronate monooxygenase
LDICVKHKVPLVITSLGAIADLVNVVHGYGGLVYHDIIKKRHAEKAAEAGVDGLIVVAAGAGGHAGTLHPIPLINEVKKVFDKKIVLSGCLSTGKDIASALQMGADMAYMGTRFINVDESMADEAYKKMIMESSAEDIVYTAAVSGVNASFLRPSLEAMGITEKHWKETKKIDFGSETDAVSEEAKAWKTIWSAGQGVSNIHDSLRVSELIAKLKTEFTTAIKSQQELLSRYQ